MNQRNKTLFTDCKDLGKLTKTQHISNKTRPISTTGVFNISERNLGQRTKSKHINTERLNNDKKSSLLWLAF